MKIYDFYDYKQKKEVDVDIAYAILNNNSENMMVNAVLDNNFRLALEIILEEVESSKYKNVKGSEKQIRYGAISNIVKYCSGALSLETYMDFNYSTHFNDFIKFLNIHKEEMFISLNKSPLKDTKRLKSKTLEMMVAISIKVIELDGFSRI